MRRVFGCSGVAALEAALLAPILVTLMIGVIDFGMALFSKAQISNALAGSAEYATLAGQRGLAWTTIATNAGRLAGAVSNPLLSTPTVIVSVNQGGSSASKCCPGSTWSCSDPAPSGFTCMDSSTPGVYLTVAVQYPFSVLFSADQNLLGVTLTDSIVAPLQ